MSPKSIETTKAQPARSGESYFGRIRRYIRPSIIVASLASLMLAFGPVSAADAKDRKFPVIVKRIPYGLTLGITCRLSAQTNKHQCYVEAYGKPISKAFAQAIEYAEDGTRTITPFEIPLSGDRKGGNIEVVIEDTPADTNSVQLVACEEGKKTCDFIVLEV